MRKASKHLRIAYISKIDGVDYNGVVIPVSDTFEGDHARVPFGDGMVTAYIVVKNQTRGANETKNCESFKSRIFIEVVTKFEGSSFGSSGAEIAEDITQSIYDRLFSGTDFTIKTFSDFSITHTTYNEVSVPAMENDTTKIFRTLSNFVHKVEVI